MNKIHKIVWNSFRHQWIVVSELVNQGKTKSTQLLLTSIFISFPTYALADCMPGSNSNNCMINATITDNASSKEYDGMENIDVVSVSDGDEAIFDFPSSSHQMYLTSHGSGNVITMNGGSIAFDNEEAGRYRGVTLKAQDDGNVIKINDG